MDARDTTSGRRPGSPREQRGASTAEARAVATAGERAIDARAAAAEAPTPVEIDERSGPSDAAGWRTWITGRSARDVLARIVRDDPLELRRRVAVVVRAEGYLLDGDRVVLRAFALVARGAARYRGVPALDAWLDGVAREAAAAIVREDGDDAASARRDAGAEAETRACSPAFLALARPLGLEPAALVRACAQFNRLPAADRRTFCSVVLRGRPAEELARELGETPAEVMRRARRGFDTLLALDARGGERVARASASTRDVSDGPRDALARGDDEGVRGADEASAAEDSPRDAGDVVGDAREPGAERDDAIPRARDAAHDPQAARP